MQIAVLTFDGFNEIDSFVAVHILNRLRPKGWKAFITSPDAVVTSMNGVVVQAERRLEFVSEADAVIIGSGVKTVELVKDAPLLARIRLDPQRQLVASQCSGTLLLAKLGLLHGRPACTDLNTKKWVVEAGVSVIDQPFLCRGQYCNCRRVPCSAVPRDVDHLAAQISGRRRGSPPACYSRRRAGRVFRTGNRSCRTLPAPRPSRVRGGIDTAFNSRNSAPSRQTAAVIF